MLVNSKNVGVRNFAKTYWRTMFVVMTVLLLGITAQAFAGGQAQKTQPSSSATQSQAPIKPVKIIYGDAGMSAQSSAVFLGKYFAERVAALSKGKINVETFDGGVLGNEAALVTQIQHGSVQMDFASIGNLATRIPEISVFSLPYIVDSFEQTYKLQDGGWAAINNWCIHDAGVRVIAQEAMGFRNFWNSKHPITKPSDFKGVTIRSTSSPIGIATWRAWGVAPQPLPWPQVFPALSQGVINGGANPWDDIVTNKLYEKAHYITPMHYDMLAHLIVMGEPFFEKLSKADQQIILKAGRETTDWGRKYIQYTHQPHQKQFVESHGGIVAQNVDQQAFKQLAVKIWPNYYKFIGGGNSTLGAEIVKQAVQIVNGTRKSFSQAVYLK